MTNPIEEDTSTVVFPTPQHANGAVNLLRQYYTVEYDEEQDAIVIGGKLEVKN